MCFQLRDALRVGNIALSSDFFSVGAEAGDMIRQLEDELRNFCVLVEAPKTPFGKGTRTRLHAVPSANTNRHT